MKRNAEAALKEFIFREEEHKNVLIVDGARQVGKTYLIEECLASISNRKISSFNLEKDRIMRDRFSSCSSFEQFESVLRQEGFTPSHDSILFIDEAQESESLGAFVRSMKEDWRHSTVILTGSSMTRLFGKQRVPVGRLEYLRVTPFCFAEYLRALNQEDLLADFYEGKLDAADWLHKELLSKFDEYLRVGGLPVVVQASVAGEPVEKLNQRRYEIFLSQEDDFHRKEIELKQHLYRDAFKAAANTIGFPFSLTRISNNHRDARAILSILSQWQLLLLCEQRGALTSNAHPKVYLYDIGLAKQLRETALPSLSLLETLGPELRTSLGGLIENSVYLNLLSEKGFLRDITGWRRSTRRPIEVDFIVKIDDRSLPVEIKAARKVHDKFLSPIIEYLNYSGQKVGVISTAAPFQVFKKDTATIINLPLYYCNDYGLKQACCI